MKKIYASCELPSSSIAANNFDKIDYIDVYTIQKRTDKTIHQLTGEIFTIPAWVNGLMSIRNAIVKWIGLKTEKPTDTKKRDYYPIGSRAVYFTVINRNDNEIVTQENDKHLDFRASVLHDKENNLIHLITLVKFNNLLGKVYFFFIKPFHKIILKSLLKRFAE